MKAPPKPQRYDKIHTIDRGLALALRVSYSGSKTGESLLRQRQAAHQDARQVPQGQRLGGL